MAATRRVGRPKSLLPTCYHDGFLEKRSFKDKMSRRFWTCLCGNSLFFFHSNKDNEYVEKLDLATFISISDDSSLDRNLDAARFQLHLKDEIVQMTAPSLEARELWKGFIYCVAELKMPSSFNLLPGQIQQLKEAVEQEKKRCKALPTPPEPAPASIATAPASTAVATTTVPASIPHAYISLLAEMPNCYYQVCRAEAEVLLDKNQDKGNLLLRQGRDGTSLAISTRQDFNSSPVFRHYRVTRQCEGFTIAVDIPIACKTLNEVIGCLVQKTGGALKPLVLEQPYEKSIMFVKANEESGEKSMEHALTSPEHLPPVAPKPALKRTPPPAKPEPIPQDNHYLNDEALVTPPVPPRMAVRTLPHQCSLPADIKINTEGKKMALLPPSWSKPPAEPQSSTETSGLKLQSRTMLQQNLTEELKLKMQRRSMSDQLTSEPTLTS